MEEYLEYLFGSLENYTNQVVNKLVRTMVSRGIATEKESEQDQKVYIGDILSGRQQLKHCIAESEQAVKNIEKWEFEKSYRYSIFLSLEEYNDKIIEQLIKGEQIKEYDTLKTIEPLYSVINIPTVKTYNNNLFFKFLVKLSATDSDGNENKCRYPVIVILYPKQSIIEIRFDSIGALYSKDKLKHIYHVLTWLRDNLNTNITPIDLRNVADYVKENGEKDGVVLAAQDMRMASGGKATIDVGNDDTKVLPFIGELKILLKEYEEEFKKSPVIKTALEEFIYDKENLSEFPWIRFRFEERSIEVKISFDYGRENFSLLQHYHSQLVKNLGKERMDYVAAYLSEVRNTIEVLSNNEDGTEEVFRSF